MKKTKLTSRLVYFALGEGPKGEVARGADESAEYTSSRARVNDAIAYLKTINKDHPLIKRIKRQEKRTDAILNTPNHDVRDATDEVNVLNGFLDRAEGMRAQATKQPVEDAKGAGGDVVAAALGKNETAEKRPFSKSD